MGNSKIDVPSFVLTFVRRAGLTFQLTATPGRHSLAKPFGRRTSSTEERHDADAGCA